MDGEAQRGVLMPRFHHPEIERRSNNTVTETNDTRACDFSWLCRNREGVRNQTQASGKEKEKRAKRKNETRLGKRVEKRKKRHEGTTKTVKTSA